MFKYDSFELQTTVKSCVEKEGKYLVELEDTCFYVESGGQPADKGFINDIEVIDVYTYDNRIFHTVNVPVEGDVTVSINKELRDKHAQSHTAQHLISALFDQMESRTSSLSIKEDSFSIDLSKAHSQKELDDVERKANEMILEGLAVFTDGYKEGDYIGKLNGEVDTIRIIEIDGFDRNACGGTHISNLKKLKMVKIIKSKPSRGGTRIWVVVGDAAVLKVQEVFNLYSEMLQVLGNADEPVEFLTKRMKDFKKYKKQLKYLMKTTDLDIEL